MRKVVRPTRPTLSREYILDRALDLIDREGLDSFSMRKLGVAIGTDPMAIYHYFPNKAALFDGIVETIYLEIDSKEFRGGGDLRERVAESVRAMRRAFLRHHRALPLVSTRPAHTPALAALIESFLSALKEAGFRPERALDTITCLTVFTIGHALAQAAEPFGGQDPIRGQDLIEALAEFPNFAQALKEFGNYDLDRQFELGLKALIDGFFVG